MNVEHKEHNSIKLLFAGLMVTQFMSSLGQTVLSSALPTIVGELDGVEHMTWVITAFILAMTIMMPIYGKLSDLLGRKPLLIIAISLFLAGSVFGGLAQSMNFLIIARAIQGIGGGGLMILSQAAIADVVPPRERGKYMGIMGATFAVASVAGPLLGGWFTEGPGWRWAFWMNLPLGALAIIATVVFLHSPKKTFETRPKVDYLGMMLLAIATASLVLGLTWGGSVYAWTDPMIFLMFAIAVVGGALFVWAESKAAEPIMPLFLFRDRNFNLTTIAGLFIAVGMFGAIGYMPTYLQMAGGYSASIAGLLMAPMMLVLLISSTISGLFVSKTGNYKALPVVGSLVVAIALGLMSTIKVDTPVWQICAYLGVMGLGLGLVMQILTLIVQNSFSVRVVGTATAATNYFRQVGSTLGSAVVGSVFASRLLEHATQNLAALGDAAASAGSANSFTPAIVHQLPEPVRDAVVLSYNQALIPIFTWLIPMMIIAAALLLFIRPKALKTTVEEVLSAPEKSGAEQAQDRLDAPVTQVTAGASSATDPAAPASPRD